MTQEPMINDDSSKDLYDDNDQFQQDEPFFGEEEEDFYADSAELLEESSVMDAYDRDIANLKKIVNIFNACLPNLKKPSELSSEVISFSIPIEILPISLQVVYGFNNCDSIIDLRFLLGTQFDWKEKCRNIQFTNPQYQDIYPGKCLIQFAIDRFFSYNYQPKVSYRSAPFLFGGSATADSQKVRSLVAKGYSEMQAQVALSLVDNDLEQSSEFLQTGQFRQRSPTVIQVPYHQCPLLYLFLEICDAIFDLQDHCCICGASIPTGLRPSICFGEKCLYSYAEVGVGTTVVREIRRDPFVADLLLSLFVASFSSNYWKPAPPFVTAGNLYEISKEISALRSMQDLSNAQNDKDLKEQIGERQMALLQWLLLTNRSHFFHLPKELEYSQLNCAGQFLTMISSPEAENTFLQLKKHYGGSYFLWHGSPVDRWHSIIRNGLKNYSNTSHMRCGAACGEGIYFAPDSGTSIGYSCVADNPYTRSYFRNLHIVALCEVAKLPFGSDQTVQVEVMNPSTGKTTTKTVRGFLKNHGWAYTLTMEEACIVRFLFVQLSGNINVMRSPPQGLPTIHDILKTFVSKS